MEWYGTEVPSSQDFVFEDAVPDNCIDPFSCILLPHGGDVIRASFGPGRVTLFVKAGRPNARTGLAERCSMVFFRDGGARELAARLEQYASKSHVVDGTRVFQIDAPPDDTERLTPGEYAATVGSSAYVCSNSWEMITSVLDRSKQRHDARALPAALPEWKHVDTAAPAWGIRHYSQRPARNDWTTMPKRDPGAQGLTVFSGTKPTPYIALRYLSSSTDAQRRFTQMLRPWWAPAKESPPVMNIVGSGAIELRLPAAATEADCRRNHGWPIRAWCVHWAPDHFYMPLLGLSDYVKPVSATF